MSFLLAADACRAWLKGNAAVQARCVQQAGRLFVSAVTVLELELWLRHANTPPSRQFGYGALRRDLPVVNVGEDVAHAAARVGAQQSVQGRRMALTDLLIAATAVVHGLTLVTHAPPTFANFPGLTVVDWLAP